MSEPTTSSAFSALTALGFSFVGVFSSAHPSALWGAMIGAVVCMLTYSDTKPLLKIFYFLLSWACGYLFAVEIIGQGFVKTEGAIACLCAAVALPMLFGIVYILKNGKALKETVRTIVSAVSRISISFNKDKGNDDDSR